MEDKNFLNRIVVDPKIMTGKPVIKGTRLTVQYILGLLAQGMGTEDILKEYKNVSKEDIFACLIFAQNALDQTVFAPLSLHR